MKYIIDVTNIKYSITVYVRLPPIIVNADYSIFNDLIGFLRYFISRIGCKIFLQNFLKLVVFKCQVICHVCPALIRASSGFLLCINYVMWTSLIQNSFLLSFSTFFLQIGESCDTKLMHLTISPFAFTSKKKKKKSNPFS